MAKILVLNNWPVHPAKTGGEHAVAQLCAGLSRRQPCTFAYLGEFCESEVRREIGPQLVAVALAGRRHATWRARLRAPGFLCSDKLVKFALRAQGAELLVASLRQLISEHDVVIFTHPWSWPTAQGLPELKDKFVIYDSHNVESALAQDVPASYLKRWASSRAVARIERSLCERADLILACTAEDRAHYIDHFHIDPAKIETGFKGVSCAAHVSPTAEPGQNRERSALFVGSEWPPNNLAAQTIAQQLGPALPSFDWLIAGTCSKHVPSLPSSNVRLMGFVEDLPALMQRALVAVNPITTGSGINMKMMEYLAAGLPVVTTPFGARGITGRARQALVICELPDFAKAVEQLANDPERWRQLSDIARSAALEQFDWAAITDRLSDLIHARLPAHASALLSVPASESLLVTRQ